MSLHWQAGSSVLSPQGVPGVVHFYLFFLWLFVLLVIMNKPLPNPSQIYLLFSSNSFGKVLALIFRSVIHFKLLFKYDII